ncbi:MAG: polymer-forming cytoskeletal protein [bacterium]|nr:polymer-forming cytoskeletal protein [bacterium]
MHIQKTLGLLLGALLIPAGVFAASFKTGPASLVQENESISGDLYTAGRTTIVNGLVMGDLVAAGGDIRLSGRVEGDVLVAGGSMHITGSVTDDVRVAGGTVLISGTISGDVLAAGGEIHILPDAYVGGDVLAAGGKISLDGKIAGNVKAAGGNIFLNGFVGGNVGATGKNITVGSLALINGTLTYRSSRTAFIDPSARILGEVEAKKLPGNKKKFDTARHILGSMLFVLKFGIALFTTLILVHLFKNRTKELLERAHKRLGMNILTGFIVLIVVPAAIVLSALTVVGIFFAALGLLWYLVILAFSCVFMGVLAGERLWHLITKKSLELHWKSVTLGVAALALIHTIPVLGWFVAFFFFLWSLGTMATYWYERVWKNR